MVLTTPSGVISRIALCAFAAVPVRRVCARGVSGDTESNGSITSTVCAASDADPRVTVTVGPACDVRSPAAAGAGDGAIGASPLITAA